MKRNYREGLVGPGRLHVRANQTAPYVWQGDENAGVRVLQGWTPVTDGSQPPQLAGELFNDALDRQTFN